MFSVPDELLMNLASLTVLFVYMFKDISAVIQATWYYVRRVEKEAKHGHDVDFVQFRILMLCSFVLYAALLFYTIFEMNQVHNILVKLEVALEIFFVLEVDDWAYLLFIAQNDFLDDEDFDVHVSYEVDAKERQKNRETRLWISLLVVFMAIITLVVSSE